VSTTERPRKRYQRHPKQLRDMAMERLKNCDNVTALAQELGIERTVLYKWRERLEGREGKKRGQNEPEQIHQSLPPLHQPRSILTKRGYLSTEKRFSAECDKRYCLSEGVHPTGPGPSNRKFRISDLRFWIRPIFNFLHFLCDARFSNSSEDRSSFRVAIHH
jgi:transposase-like protein